MRDNDCMAHPDMGDVRIGESCRNAANADFALPGLTLVCGAMPRDAKYEVIIWNS